MSLLENLTEEQINNAFLRAVDEVTITNGKLVRITEEYYEQALDLYRDHLLPDESMYKAAGVQWGDRIKDMTLMWLRQNLSIMIINETTEEGMAFLINGVALKEPMNSECDSGDQGFKDYMMYWQHCEQEANLFEHFNVTEAVWLRSIATNRTYRNMGLGTRLVKATLAMIRGFDIGPVCVKTECSSLYSQRICENEGMLCLYSGEFDEHVVGGRKPFAGTGIHTSLNIYGMMVQSN